MDKPYIKLDESFPGIVSLFIFDKETGKNLSAMGQTIMRRPRGLSVGERELIAAFVSKLNRCNFCHESHAACAAQYLDSAFVSEVCQYHTSDGISDKLRTLMHVAMDVTRLDRDLLEISMLEAKAAGATDEEIHDTVLVTAFFNMCNRYVDGLGTTFLPGQPEEGGKSLAKYGYTMTIRRFFKEILPKMWKKFWNK